MPRRALRCIVDLQLHAVSAPGVWLPSKEDVYVSISLFNQYRNTRQFTSIFPLLINEKFRFEKTYYTAVDPSQVAEMMEDELVIFELVQLSEYSDGAVRLASYSTNARDFLYPYPTLAPAYSANEREILMCRTIAFPGISPKLEFSSKTVIKESISPELDALDDAVDMERESRTMRKTRRRPTRYPDFMSASPVRRRLAEITLEDTIDPRPPFVVRKLENDLIGRKPTTSASDKLAKSKPKRSVSPYRSPSRSGSRKAPKQFVDDLNLSTYTTRPSYRLSKVIRDPYIDPLPVFKPRYVSKLDDEIDREVEALTSTKSSSYLSPRPRSVSPLLYRSSFSDRYGDLGYRTYTPSYYETLADRELERARARRWARLYGTYYSSIDDLDLELRLARLRASRYL